MDAFLGVKFACYIKMMAFDVVELLHNHTKGVTGDTSLNLAQRTWVGWTRTNEY